MTRPGLAPGLVAFSRTDAVSSSARPDLRPNLHLRPVNRADRTFFQKRLTRCVPIEVAGEINLFTWAVQLLRMFDFAQTHDLQPGVKIICDQNLSIIQRTNNTASPDLGRKWNRRGLLHNNRNAVETVIDTTPPPEHAVDHVDHVVVNRMICLYNSTAAHAQTCRGRALATGHSQNECEHGKSNGRKHDKLEERPHLRSTLDCLYRRVRWRNSRVKRKKLKVNSTP